MSRDAAEILKDAPALPLDARASLIGPLLDSLDAEVDEGADEAWREELRRRLHEIDSGTAKLVQWDEARRRLFARSAGLEFVQLIMLRVLRNSINCAVEFIQKRFGGAGAAPSVPLHRCLGLLDGRRPLHRFPYWIVVREGTDASK